MKNFFSIINIFLILFAIHPTASAKMVTISYDDLPLRVKEQNLKVQAKQNLALAQKTQTGHLAKSFLPEITTSAGYETFRTGNLSSRTQPWFKANARVNLFHSGKDVLEGKIRHHQYDIAKLNLKNEYLEQLTQARHLFASCYYYQTQTNSIRNIINDLSLLDRQTRSKYQSGLIPSSELQAIQIFGDQLKAEFTLLEEDYEHTLDELRIALGIPLNQPIALKIKTSHRHVSFDNQSPNNHPSLQALENEMAISEKRRKQYNLWWAPSLEAYGSYDLYTFREREYFNQSDRDEYVGGVELKMNLFDKLSSLSKSQAQKYKTRALSNEKNYLDQELQAVFKKLNHGLQVRHKLLHQAQGTVALSQQHLTQLKQEFDNGIKNSTDLISAYESLLFRKEKVNEYQKDHAIIEANLLALTEADN